MYIYVFFICMYNICLFLMEIYYEELSPVVMEAESSTICVCTPEPQGSVHCDSICIGRPANQGSRWHKSQSDGGRRGGGMSAEATRQEKGDMFFLPQLLFYLDPQCIG